MRKNLLIFYLILFAPCSIYTMHGIFSSDDLYARDGCGCNGCTRLHIAAEKGDTDQVQKLLKAGIYVDIIGGNQTPLHNAARSGREEVVRILLAAKASIEARNSPFLHCTPLHNAANSAGVVRILLNAKARVDAVDCSGNTPLHEVASKGNKEIVKMLLDARANINAHNNSGYTPLNHLALTNIHSNPLSNVRGVVKVLVHRGADIEAKVPGNFYAGKTAEEITEDADIRNFLRSYKPFLTFLMASHPRLGEHSPARVLPKDLFHKICKRCISSVHPEEHPRSFSEVGHLEGHYNHEHYNHDMIHPNIALMNINIDNHQCLGQNIGRKKSFMLALLKFLFGSPSRRT